MAPYRSRVYIALVFSLLELSVQPAEDQMAVQGRSKQETGRCGVKQVSSTLALRNVHTLLRNKTLAILFTGAIMVVFTLHTHVTLSFLQYKMPYELLPRLVYATSDLPTNTSVYRRKIIILSYMRSGSTLCGDILQAHPDVFYVYEPLLYLWDYYVPRKEVQGVNVRQRAKNYWRQRKAFLPEPLDFLDYMFMCNLTIYNVGFLTNVIHSQDFTAVGCLNSWKHMNVIVNLTQDCVDRVHQRCIDSNTIVQKVVRLSMAEADTYLRRDPSVRIIHLVRDPRGILLSRMNFNQKTSGEMHNNYTSVCRRIWDDIKVSRELASQHWGRILTIRYEDVAQNPLALATILYRFAGLELLPSIKSYVRSITTSENLRDNGKVTAKKTSRKHPFRTAYRWRLELPFSLVREVDQTCRNVLNAMGYVSYPTEEQFRNMEIPAKLNSYGKGLMTTRFV